jgi:hypothetical protein
MFGVVRGYRDDLSHRARVVEEIAVTMHRGNHRGHPVAQTKIQ